VQLPVTMKTGWMLTESISEFDLRQSDWTKQAIVWYKNGNEFHRVTGATVNSQAVWKTLAAQPLYIIFNVAVGGDFVSSP
jgi:beta-glucanase (GH16 family)